MYFVVWFIILNTKKQIQRPMKTKSKARDIAFEGVFIIGLCMFILAYFMSECANGLCTPDWLVIDVTGSILTQIVLFMTLYIHLKNSGRRIYKEKQREIPIIEMYRTVCFGAFMCYIYGIVYIFLPNRLDESNQDGTLLLFIDLEGISLWIIVLCEKMINRFHKRMVEKSRAWTRLWIFVLR